MKNSLLFCVRVHKRRSQYKSSTCTMCSIGLNVKMVQVHLLYYDIEERTEHQYYFYTCRDCFNKRIKDKHLDKLLYVLPLIKMKNHEFHHASYYGGKDIFSEEKDATTHHKSKADYCKYAGRLKEAYEK